MKRIIYILAEGCLMMAALLAASGPLSAQQPLTVELSRRMALENNKQTAIAAEQSEMAAYGVKTYKANFLPRITATGNYLLTTASLEKIIPPVYLPTYVPDAGGQLVPNILTSADGVPLFKEYAFFPGMELSLKPNNTYIAGLRVEQPIYTGGKITAAYRMARIGEEMAQLNEVKSRAEVILQADEAYWTYVEMLELEKTACAYCELVMQLERDVENGLNAGMMSRNDLLKVQVKMNEADLQLLRAENGVRLARMNLCHVVGLPLNSEVAVESSPDSPVTGEVPLPDLGARPEYGLLSKQIALKEQQAELVKSDFLPRVGIAGNMSYANGLELNGSKLLDHTAFSAVVSVNIPLFHWGEGRNKVRSAESEKRMVALRRDELVEKMNLEIEQALQAYNEAEARVMLASRSLGQVEENLRESSDRYETGLETLSDLMEAQTMWQQAHAEQVQARSAARIAETRYLKAAGRL
ncbi:MAG: TolC family protein [bacterium]|nr:TolC family protein [bacterium]MDD4460017.1 TolC family protein [Proteiniphilum sp.]